METGEPDACCCALEDGSEGGGCCDSEIPCERKNGCSHCSCCHVAASPWILAEAFRLREITSGHDFFISDFSLISLDSAPESPPPRMV